MFAVNVKTLAVSVLLKHCRCFTLIDHYQQTKKSIYSISLTIELICLFDLLQLFCLLIN